MGISLSNLLDRVFGKQATDKRSKPRRKRRLNMESLESRLTMTWNFMLQGDPQNPQWYTVLHDKTLTADTTKSVLLNDMAYDPSQGYRQGLQLGATLVSGPSHALSFQFNGNGTFSYTATAGYVGTDMFTYRATYTDQNNVTWVSTSTANAVITVYNTLPTGNQDTYTVVAGQSRFVAASKGLLINDERPTNPALPNSPNRMDYDGDPLSVSTVAADIVQGQHGTAALNSDGSFTYTAFAGYHGTDTFKYKVVDNGNGKSQFVSVVVRIWELDIWVDETGQTLGGDGEIIQLAPRFIGRKLDDGWWVSQRVGLQAVFRGPGEARVDATGSNWTLPGQEILHGDESGDYFAYPLRYSVGEFRIFPDFEERVDTDDTEVLFYLNTDGSKQIELTGFFTAEDGTSLVAESSTTLFVRAPLANIAIDPFVVEMTPGVGVFIERPPGGPAPGPDGPWVSAVGTVPDVQHGSQIMEIHFSGLVSRFWDSLFLDEGAGPAMGLSIYNRYFVGGSSNLAEDGHDATGNLNEARGRFEDLPLLSFGDPAYTDWPIPTAATYDITLTATVYWQATNMTGEPMNDRWVEPVVLAHRSIHLTGGMAFTPAAGWVMDPASTWSIQSLVQALGDAWEYDNNKKPQHLPPSLI